MRRNKMPTYVLVNPQNPNQRVVVDFPGNVQQVQQWAHQNYGIGMAAYTCPVSKDKPMVLCSQMAAPTVAAHAPKKPDGDMIQAHADDESGIQPHEEDGSGFETTNEEALV
jgi:hypothetical protein